MVFSKSETFPANTLKINFAISSWPFKSISNTLDVEMDNEATEIDGESGCETSSESNLNSGGYLQSLKITLNSITVYLTEKY